MARRIPPEGPRNSHPDRRPGHGGLACGGHPAALPSGPSLAPLGAGASRERFSEKKSKKWVVFVRRGRPPPPHPRLPATETKTWIRGTSPRKTTLTRLI